MAVTYIVNSNPSSRLFPIPVESHYNPNSISGPCTFPLPYTQDFHIFCQSDYHQSNYVCDPSGELSRTEVDLLDSTVTSMNMTSCFCRPTCSSTKLKLSIVIVPAVSIHSIVKCDSSLEFAPPSSLPSAAFLFSQLLSKHWQEDCDADLMMIYIKSWSPEKIKRPFLVPIYKNGLERLQRYSHPSALSNRESVMDSIRNALRHSQKLIQAELTEKFQVNASIPRWAVSLTFGMVAVVCLAIYIANCVTNKLGKASQSQKSTVASVRKSSDRFRAGFGGGMMMNSAAQSKKSVMMFRTFSKPNRNGNMNRL